MKKLFVILLTGVIALSLVSCLPRENKVECLLPAVVDRDPFSYPFLLTAIGKFIAPELAPTTLESGTCILAYFIVDYDNQPAEVPPYMASELICDIIGESNAKIVADDFDETAIFDDTDFSAEDIFPIQGLNPQLYNPILKGKIFLIFNHSAPQDQTANYTAIVKPAANVDEPVNLYLIAKKTNAPEGFEINRNIIHAVDMCNVIRVLGTETTIEGKSALELKINIQYCTGVDRKGGNDIPKYQEYKYNGVSTIPLSVFK